MARRLITKRLGEVLLERGALTQQQLEQALAHQQQRGGLMGQILIQLGFVTEEEVALTLTAQYGFPYLPLDNYEIEDGLMAAIPEAVARQYCLIPIDRIGNALTIAMSDPTNVQAIEEIELLTTCVVQTFVSTPTDIVHALDKLYKRAGSGAHQSNTPPPPPAQAP